MRRSSFRQRGFTIVELLVAMAILGILAGAVMPLGEALVTAQRERELKQALWEIRGAIDEFKKVSDRSASGASPSATSGYPPTLQALVDGVQDSRPENSGKAVYFLRQIPRDPFAASTLPAEQTWRLRSYASPADRPLPGSDVYDVRSSSDATALDGSTYASW